MQNSSQPKLIQTPFADNGARQNIPNDSQIGINEGRASYIDGFPPLTRTPLAAGGVPPFGTDFNGVLNDITAAIRWSQAGSGYPFNAAFSTAISGYPKGAKIPNSNFDGFWLNTVEGNTANPENTTSAITGWVPSGFYGVTSITGLSGSSVTLTTLQAGKDRIILSGALTSNINLIVPAWVKTWSFLNNCTGSFSVTVKTPNGSGIAVPAGATAILSGDGTNINQGATPGSLLNIQIFTANGTAAKTPGAKKWKIKVLGGGGGSSAAPATGAGQVSVSNGGGAGAYAEGIYDVTSISTAAVTIGSGGAGGNSSSQYGVDGSTTSVGNLISAPGGKAGLPAGPANPPFQPVANNNGASPANWNIVGSSGPGAEAAVAVSTNYAAGSRGANSQLGVGGSIPAINNNANTGGGFGSGASGCANGTSQPINAGAAGRSGIAIIEEYA